MKKTICILLTVILTVSVAVSCTEKKPKDEHVSKESVSLAEGSSEKEPTPVVAEKKYDGQKIRIITANEAGNGIDAGVLPDEADDKITESIYKRDRTVEDSLGIVLDVTAYDSYVTSYNTFADSVRSNSDDFDFSFVRTDLAFPFASEGTLENLTDYGYIDLGMPWWDGPVNGDHLIGKSLFAAVGPISVNDLLRTHMILFNANIFDDRQIKYPYEDVDNGTWTIDKFASLATELNESVNGEIVRYGLASYAWCSAYTLWYGCDGSVIGHDDGGMPIVDIDMAKSTAIYNKLNNAVNGSNSNFVYDANDYGKMYQSFNDGEVAMTEACMMHLTHWQSFREMKDDYGIVPAPKFDENQKNYVSYAEVVEPAVCVPTLARNREEMISSVIELMAYESYKRVTPAVFETSLKERFSRDELSKKMLDIIAGSRRSCLGSVFIPTTSFTTALPTILFQKVDAVASYLDKYQSTMIGSLATAMEKFQ